MELGLSLGDTSKSLRFIEKAPVVTKNSTTEFCMGLSLASNTRRAEQKHTEKGSDVTKTSMTNNTEKLSSVSPPLQLGLIRSHVPHSHNIPLASSEKGNSDGCSSGHVTRGVDVNRVPLAEETEDMAAASLNGASYIHTDLCVYREANDGDESGEAERATSRASDEDEHSNTRKKLRLSKEQSFFLEENFKKHCSLNPKQKLALAKQLGLRPRQVEVWFQNRRARTKLKQTEVDCEYLKRCCETLTEENRRLLKEIQELRALKTSIPFYMQLPATTLTMCPSCELVATTTISSSPCFARTSSDHSPKAASIPQGSTASHMLPILSLVESSHQQASP